MKDQGSPSRVVWIWIVIAQSVALVPASLAQQSAVVAGTVVSITGAPTKGSRSAGVAFIEYADFECPYCAAFFRDALPALEREYIKTGKVLFVFKHRPLSSLHPNAVTAASGAECAGEQGSFWPMHDLLFMDQTNLSKASLLARAGRLGLDGNSFSDCLEFGRGAKRVSDDEAAATALRITATPTFLVGMFDRRTNMVQVEEQLEGARPSSYFQPVLERLLARAK
jgi:protein-disulfide isomerase